MKTARLHASFAGGKTSPYLFAPAFLGRSIWLCLAFLLFFFLTQAVQAANPPDLNSLETRFFEHTYPQNSEDDRLSRLEKMVFGEAHTGDDQTRLQQLINAVPAQTADSGQSSGQSNGQSKAANGNGQSGQNQAGDDSDNASGTSYPRVTELESVILGKTFQAEPIKHRLDQLELKIFNKSYAGQDLADRVDRIAQYADKKYRGMDNFAQSEPVNGSLDEKVSWLEMQIEGQSFPQKSMIDRLRPLEKAMFPTDPTDIHASIPEQVNMLMSAVELLHKQQIGQASGDQELSIAPLNQQQQQQQQQRQQRGYAQQSGGSDLQREFEEDNGPAPQPSYRPQQAYSAPSYAQPQYQSQPAYTQSQAYQPQPSYTQSQQSANNTHQSHGHPFFRGLAKALGEVGAMVGSSVMSGGMMNGYGTGYGGYGGYGMPGAYGMGNGGAVFGFP